MKMQTKILILMIIMSFGFLTMRSVSADWWERGDQPLLPRDETIFPTNPPQPTSVQPTNPPNGAPSVTPPPQGGLEVTTTPSPTGSSSSDDDPCASGKSYTGDYCGWSPRIGGDDGSSGDNTYYDPGEPPVLGLSYTGKGDIGLSDIMLLT